MAKQLASVSCAFAALLKSAFFSSPP